MLTPTHLAGGYLVLSAARPIYQPKPENGKVNRFLMALGLLLSVGIDVDSLWVHPNHHMSLLHYPIFWATLFLVMTIIGTALRSSTLKAAALVVLISAMVHLFLDTFGVTMGIMWLYPFSTTEFSFTPLHPIFDSWLDWLRYYLAQPVMFTEVSVMVLGFLKWVMDRNKYIPFRGGDKKLH